MNLYLILFIVILILWIVSILKVFVYAKSHIESVQESSDATIAELTDQIKLLQTELERERAILKGASDEKKKLHSGDNRADFDRATAIMSKSAKN